VSWFLRICTCGERTRRTSRTSPKKYSKVRSLLDLPCQIIVELTFEKFRQECERDCELWGSYSLQKFSKANFTTFVRIESRGELTCEKMSQECERNCELWGAVVVVTGAGRNIYLHIYSDIYIHIYVYMYVFIYIYIRI